MISFSKWSNEETEEVGAYSLHVLSIGEDQLDTVLSVIKEVVPHHYVSPDRLARTFEKLGKPAVANLLRAKLPRNKSKRSGELGEIFATEYIDGQTSFKVPIKRLRWKDHREMAMRGDDVIGLRLSEHDGRIQFLKTEAKSRAVLSRSTIIEARVGLDSENGLPTSHALTFISERLLELSEENLADAIDQALLVDGITVTQVTHLLFTFTGNAPNGVLKKNLEHYDGRIAQLAVGLVTDQHQAFIANIYDEVVPNDES